jgi:1L-myo-inositol 1-phosphate cytidylyltransferase / CDP-L-myo-inositol myo-inositolphosphotransferase
VIGALLFWLHSVLDGCDGELARLKFQESRFGGLLDFFGDNLVHSVVFFCIAIGWRNHYYAPFAPLLGALAVCGTIASASFVYWTTMREKKSEEPLFTSVAQRATATSRFIDFLARRDFIYLVIILAIFGKIHWFLIMGALGAPVYFLVLIFLHLRSGNQS